MQAVNLLQRLVDRLEVAYRVALWVFGQVQLESAVVAYQPLVYAMQLLPVVAPSFHDYQVEVVSVGLASPATIDEILEALAQARKHISPSPVLDQFGQVRQSHLLSLRFFGLFIRLLLFDLLTLLSILLDLLFAFLALHLKGDLVNAHLPVEAVQQSVSELALPVPVEDYLAPFAVAETRTCRDYLA